MVHGTMRRPIVRKFTITLEACPWQAEGRLDDGRFIYMRHRFCLASLGFGHDLESAVQDSFRHEIEYHEDNGDCGKPAGQGFCSGLQGEEIAYVFQRLCEEIG